MRVVCDIEANGLDNPTEVWLVVLKDIDTGEHHVYRNITSDMQERQRFLDDAKKVSLWIGHNILGYDFPVLSSLVNFNSEDVFDTTCDTLVVSKLLDYSRAAHSLEQYGIEMGHPKGSITDFSKFDPAMVDYCIRDTDITHKVYLKYSKHILHKDYKDSLRLEHQFQIIVNTLHNNGFSFNKDKAISLLSRVEKELGVLDKEILKEFPPKLKLIREITPKETKFGTLSKSDFRFVKDGDLSEYNGGPFCRCEWAEFNPSSHRQIVEVLSNSGWSPIDKTATHIETERELNRLKYGKREKTSLDIATQDAMINKLEELRKTGWRVNENNLSTLPSSAPSPARTLAKRILLEARRRTLTEWINLICLEIKISNESIKALGQEINAQMIQSGVPRSANITDKDIEKEILNYLEQSTCTTELFTHKKRENVSTILKLPTDFLCKILINFLKSKKVNVSSVVEKENYQWITIIPQVKLEGSSASLATQCLDGLKTRGLEYSITSERIKGHYYGIGAWTHRMAHQHPNTANIPTDAKLYGAEMRSLWRATKNRLLVGVDAEGIQLRIFAHYINDPDFTRSLVEGKKEDKSDPHSLNARILGDVCEGRQIAKRFIYALLLGAGLDKLAAILGCSREEAQKALDRILERYTGFAKLKSEVIPADASRGWFRGLDGRLVRIPGSTQGERKHLTMSGYLQNGEAVIMKRACVKWASKLKEYDALLVNFVHDEWQTECPNNMEIALKIAKLQADSLREVGEELKLLCPLAGSYWNEDAKDFTIGTNWHVTH